MLCGPNFGGVCLRSSSHIPCPIPTRGSACKFRQSGHLKVYNASVFILRLLPLPSRPHCPLLKTSDQQVTSRANVRQSRENSTSLSVSFSQIICTQRPESVCRCFIHGYINRIGVSASLCGFSIHLTLPSMFGITILQVRIVFIIFGFKF